MTPKTAAGRALLAELLNAYGSLSIGDGDAILAIEAEAAALERERIRAALPDPMFAEFTYYVPDGEGSTKRRQALLRHEDVLAILDADPEPVEGER